MTQLKTVIHPQPAFVVKVVVAKIVGGVFMAITVLCIIALVPFVLVLNFWDAFRQRNS